ncbi:MAG: replication protein [Abditibacteriota bacterium]|nr:replication protein [Abditibacteriota bacterium]
MTGYTQVNNTLLRTLCILKPNEAKVMLFLVRYTAGFHKTKCKASYGVIARWCSIDKSCAVKAVRALQEKGLLSVSEERPRLILQLDMKKVCLALLNLRAEHFIAGLEGVPEEPECPPDTVIIPC